jgi:hypothetical protein
MTLDHVQSAEDEAAEQEELAQESHEEIVVSSDIRTHVLTPYIVTRKTAFESISMGILDKLHRLGIKAEDLPRDTLDGQKPPCFDTLAEYQDWMKAAASSPPMLRLSRPAEFNYCQDCTPAYKRSMFLQSRCKFPGTTFEKVKMIGEVDTVGITRNRQVPVESQVIYRGMLVEKDSIGEFEVLDDAKRDGSRVKVGKQVPRRAAARLASVRRRTFKSLRSTGSGITIDQVVPGRIFEGKKIAGYLQPNKDCAVVDRRVLEVADGIVTFYNYALPDNRRVGWPIKRFVDWAGKDITEEFNKTPRDTEYRVIRTDGKRVVSVG